MLLSRDRFAGGKISAKTRSPRGVRHRFRPMSPDRLEERLVLTPAPTTLVVAAVSGTYGGSGTVTANLTSSGTPIAGEAVDLRIGAFDLGPVVTDTNGNATIPAASLASINAGTYTGDVTASFPGDANFNPSSDANNLTVTPAALTITANDQTKIYGSNLPILSASYTGFVSGDTSFNLTTAPTLTTSATASSHVAESPYPITANGAADPNYTISYVTGNLSVTTAPLTITPNNQTKAYGASVPTLTFSYIGLVNGDTATNFPGPPTIITTASASSHVTGNIYPIIASNASDSDYAIRYTQGGLGVTPVSLQITANSQTKVYGASLPTLTASYTGLVNGDIPTSLPTRPTLATSATVSSHVVGNPYTITASGAVDPDYTINYTGGNLTVTTAPLTVAADNQTKVYGASLPTLTASYSGFVNADTATNLTTAPTLATAATASSHVANIPYTIAASGAVDSDYAINYTGGSLVVTPAPLNVAADNQTKVYGAALPTLTVSYTGLVNGDTPSTIFTQPTLATTATASSHVAGSPYTITASGEADPDYTISYTAGSLVVTPAPLTIVIDNLSKVYGQANPALTGTITGALPGDVVMANYATTASGSSDVVTGGYPISLSGLSGANATDYSSIVTGAVVTPGILSVTPAPLTVAATNQTKVYGQANPTFTASYSGFVLGQNPSVLSGTLALNSQVTAATHFGIYLITPSGLTSTNYAINYANAGIAVTPAPLTVTAPSLAKTYGQPVPTLMASYSGFVNGDTPANLTSPVNVTTPATAASHVAFYPTIPGGASSLDYAITYADGILANFPALLTATASSGVVASGQPVTNLSVSYSGFVNGDTAANLITPSKASTQVSAASGAGFYTVFADGGSSYDYTVVNKTGILDVLPPATVPLNSGQVAFLNSLYKDIVGRPPEAFGVGFWISRLNQGTSKASVVQQIYQSNEAVTFRATHRGHTVSQAKALSNANQAQLKAR